MIKGNKKGEAILRSRRCTKGASFGKYINKQTSWFDISISVLGILAIEFSIGLVLSVEVSVGGRDQGEKETV